MTDQERKAMKIAFDALLLAAHTTRITTCLAMCAEATDALRQALAQPKYRRGDRLLCLENEEYCVIHISGTDRQWVKFSDSQIAVYTNEQVRELFELMPKEKDEALAQPEQEPVAYLNIEIEGTGGYLDWDNDIPASWYKSIPLYTAPPKQWVGLHLDDMPETYVGDWSFLQGAKLAEAKLKEKNT